VGKSLCQAGLPVPQQLAEALSAISGPAPNAREAAAEVMQVRVGQASSPEDVLPWLLDTDERRGRPFA
jgi:hypothetical protein